MATRHLSVLGSEGLTPCAEYKTRYSAEASETKRVPGGQLVSWGPPVHTGRRHTPSTWEPQPWTLCSDSWAVLKGLWEAKGWVTVTKPVGRPGWDSTLPLT